MSRNQQLTTSPVVVRSDTRMFAARRAALEQELAPVIEIMTEIGAVAAGFQITDAGEVRLNRSARIFDHAVAEKLEIARTMIRERAAESTGGLLALPNAMIVKGHLGITLFDDYGAEGEHRVGEVWESDGITLESEPDTSW